MAGDYHRPKGLMRRFFIEPSDLHENSATLSGEEFVHMARVLRSKPGEIFVLLDGSGYEYTAVLKEILEDHAVLTITDKKMSEAEPNAKVTLYQGMPKSQKLDTVVQKSVELGAAGIVPFVSARCVKTPRDFDRKNDRLQRIAAEAVKQSQRAAVPKIGKLADFKGLVRAVSAHALALVCYENEKKLTLKQVLTKNKSNDIAVIIGPEGGFEPSEIETLAASGAVVVTLGKRILRTETAGPAALAQIMYEREPI